MRWSDRQRRMLGEMGLRVWDSSQGEAMLTQADPHGSATAGVAEHDVQAPQAAPGGDRVQPARSGSEPPFDRSPSDAALRASSGTERVAGHGSAPSVGIPGQGACEVASMDWQALRSAVAACTACRLCERRSNTVFGVGHPQAHWMIVGEAPGEQEDRRGEPFVGKAGQLLDSMLAAIGLTRADDSPQRQVFIANTLKCRPPGNRNPEPDELARCEPFLVRQVALVQPRIILAMGRFAVQSLLRSDEPVGRLRGRVHRYEGVPLVVTYHPAYLLRNPDDKARAWEDLCLAREAATQAGAR